MKRSLVLGWRWGLVVGTPLGTIYALWTHHLGVTKIIYAVDQVPIFSLPLWLEIPAAALLVGSFIFAMSLLDTHESLIWIPLVSIVLGGGTGLVVSNGDPFWTCLAWLVGLPIVAAVGGIIIGICWLADQIFQLEPVQNGSQWLTRFMTAPD